MMSRPGARGKLPANLAVTASNLLGVTLEGRGRGIESFRRMPIDKEAMLKTLKLGILGQKPGAEARKAAKRLAKRRAARRKAALAKGPKRPRHVASDKWVARDYAIEGVKRTTVGAERKWAQWRTLQKWWKTYASDLGEAVLQKELEQLQTDGVLLSKSHGRSWKLGGRARECTYVPGSWRKGSSHGKSGTKQEAAAK